jgi:ubiquinone/menaquinone biosynthesis C-methylase UbiE
MKTTNPDRPSRDDRHFDRWAKRYDHSWLQPVLFGPVQRSVVAALVHQLPATAAVLDIGCGTGQLLDRFRVALPGATLIGIDRSGGMVAAARRLRPHLNIERAAAEAVPHPDSSFDAVVTTLSFHHWSDRPAALAEVRRALRPGGLFALTDASPDDLPGRPRAVWAAVGRSMADMPDLDERRRLVEGAGLRVLNVIPTLRRRWIKLTVAQRPPENGQASPSGAFAASGSAGSGIPGLQGFDRGSRGVGGGGA